MSEISKQSLIKRILSNAPIILLFISVLNELSEKELVKYKNEKWSYDFQKRKYINFIQE